MKEEGKGRVEGKTDVPYTILIVEDDKALSRLIQKKLQKKGYRTNGVSSGDEAITWVTNYPNTLMLLDYKLPNISGKQIIDILARRKCRVPFIIMTGYGDEKIAVEMMKLGARDYLVKEAGFLDLLPAVVKQAIEHLTAERRLNDVEEGFRKLSRAIDQSPSTIMIMDTDGNIEYVNPKFTELTGYIPEEIIGKKPSILRINETHHEEYKRLWSAITSGREWKGEFHNKKKSGELYWEYAYISAIKNDENLITHFIKVGEDITKRKKAELALRKSEEKYRRLIESLQDNYFFYSYNTEGAFKYISPSLTNVIGYFPEEFLTHFTEYLTDNPINQAAVRYTKLSIQGKKLPPYEVEIYHKDGSIRILQVQEVPILDGNGKVAEVEGIAEDITKRKQAEGKLLQSEKLRSLGVMASGIAHDFNNILAVISGNAQLLESSYRDHEELTNGLRTICRAARDGAETVRRMHEFTRMKGNSFLYIPVALKQLIKQAIEFTKHRWKHMAQSKGIAYDINMDDVEAETVVFGNLSELREVFVNIINNSLDAMPDGGRISFRIWREKDDAFIGISDNGIGMSNEEKKRIFDPFFTTKGIKGTGLGMSVVYGIIARHSGKIEVESHVGKGSKFTLRLPISKEKISPNVFPEPIREIMPNNDRILLVDDLQDINKFLNTFLSREGYNVKCINNGAEAIKLLKKENFDLLLCDLGMPDVTGREVIEALDTLDKKPKVGIITGWRYEKDEIESEGLKVDFVITKPFNFSELRTYINKVFNAE